MYIIDFRLQVIKEKKITTVKEEEFSVIDIRKEKVIRKSETFSLKISNQVSISDKTQILEVIKKTTKSGKISLNISNY